MVCIRGDWKTEMPGTGESGNGIMNQKAQQERYEGAALQVGQGERAEGRIEQAKQIKQTKRLRLRVPQSVERIKAMGLYRDYRALEKNDKVALTHCFLHGAGWHYGHRQAGDGLVDDVRAVHRERRVLRDAMHFTILHCQSARSHASNSRSHATVRSGKERLPSHRRTAVLHRVELRGVLTDHVFYRFAERVR